MMPLLTLAKVPDLTYPEQCIVDEFGGWVGFMRALRLSPQTYFDTEIALATVRMWAVGYQVPSPEGQIANNDAHEDDTMDVSPDEPQESEKKN